MHFKKIEKAHKLMEASGEEIKTCKGATDELLLDVHDLLGVKLPDDYIFSLKKLGTLTFVGEEFYGITNSGLQAKSIPCFVFATLSEAMRQ